MNAAITEYTQILRRKWRWVIWAVLLALLITTAALLAAPPVYRTTATLFVRTPGDVSLVLDGGDSYARGRAGTYAALADNTALTGRVIEDLGLDLRPAELAGRITAANPGNTALIELSVAAPSAGEALRTATVFIDEYALMVRRLEAVPGALVPRAELVTVNDPTTPVRVSRWGAPVGVVLLGAGILGVLLGATAAVVRTILERRQRISGDRSSIGAEPDCGLTGDEVQRRAQVCASNESQEGHRA